MRRGAALVVLSALVLTGCAAAPPEPRPPTTTDPSSPPPADPSAPQVVTAGLEAPWSIARAGELVLVSERDSGRILQLAEDGSTSEVGVVDGVVHGGEGGLLGLAFDGQGWLYAYSTGDGGNRIQRFTLEGGVLSEPETILDGLPSAARHNGGRIAFGPDGMLYASVGDAAVPASAQDPSSLAGKILRMTPDGDPPPDNPDTGSLVYSLGHRKMQRWSTPWEVSVA